MRSRVATVFNQSAPMSKAELNGRTRGREPSTTTAR
jgi:hypothetical protein